MSLPDKWEIERDEVGICHNIYCNGSAIQAKQATIEYNPYEIPMLRITVPLEDVSFRPMVNETVKCIN
jgi:hypothetical protein